MYTPGGLELDAFPRCSLPEITSLRTKWSGVRFLAARKSPALDQLLPGKDAGIRNPPALNPQIEILHWWGHAKPHFPQVADASVTHYSRRSPIRPGHDATWKL